MALLSEDDDEDEAALSRANALIRTPKVNFLNTRECKSNGRVTS